MPSLRVSAWTIRQSLYTITKRGLPIQHRGLLTLAIETSCDDTSVAIVEKNQPGPHLPHPHSSAKIHFLENVTADLREYRGIHPVLALQSHQENLAALVQKALAHLPVASGNDRDSSRLVYLDDGQPRRTPDFITATRGPGMRSNLSTGLDTGKALSVAWQIPFVGVHHMQAHLLTPRLVSSLARGQDEIPDSNDINTKNSGRDATTPAFPFLPILVSGGHSILVKSTSITDHEVMASTANIAIGESLDKSARDILPSTLLRQAKNTMYGKLLEEFAFPNGPADYADYRPPETRGEETVKRTNPWGWTLTTPFANTRHLQISFSSIPSAVAKFVAGKKKAGLSMAHEERVALARETMRVCFEHLASRTVIALEALRPKPWHPSGGGGGGDNSAISGDGEVQTLVVSGGVAANGFLMAVLRSFLDVRGFGHVDIIAPPPSLCTDSAAMIGWAGIEMFEAGWRTELHCRAMKKWTLDPRADDGGLLGPVGWKRV